MKKVPSRRVPGPRFGGRGIFPAPQSGGGPTPPVFSGLLDTYSGAEFAYSLRKLRAAYSGAAIRVARSSDSTEQDIGFTSSGDLDTATLLTFVGAGDGTVETWYDQSGNGRDATNQAAGPIIVSSGTLITNEHSKPAITMDGGYVQSAQASFDLGTVSGVFVTKDVGSGTAENFLLWSSAGSAPFVGISSATSGSAIASSGLTSDDAVVIDGVATTATSRSNLHSNWVAGETQTFIFSPTTTPSYTNIETKPLSYTSSSFALDGEALEFIIWPDNKSDADKIAIQTDQSGYWEA